MRGKFIVIEGADGAGTTTISRKIVTQLMHQFPPQAGSRKIIETREPSGGPVGMFIRDILSKRIPSPGNTVLKLLFRADRVDHMNKVIRPALDEGAVVVSDRGYPSTLVYQVAPDVTADESCICPTELAHNEYSIAKKMKLLYSIFVGEDDMVVPDLSIFLKVNPETARKRIDSRKPINLRCEKEDIFDDEEFQVKVHRLYDIWAKTFPFIFYRDKGIRIRSVDAEKSVDEVLDACMQFINGTL